jgi:hypothetical protein
MSSAFAASSPSPLAGEEAAHRVSDGKARGLVPCVMQPPHLPLLRNGPLLCHEGRGRDRRLAAPLLAAAILLALAAGAVAAPGDMQHPDRVAGEMFIAGATLIDPPPDEAADTHAYFSLSGAAALRLYQALKAKETRDACSPGRRLKTVKQLRCSIAAAGGDARCDFAIDLRRATIANGSVC